MSKTHNRKADHPPRDGKRNPRVKSRDLDRRARRKAKRAIQGRSS